MAWNDARFRARFGHDGQGAVTIDLQVDAELPLICQRSLEPYLEPVHRRSVLCVVRDEIEAERVPEAYDPVLLTEGKLALLDLVEDELLLAVPQVPRNPAVEAVELSTDGEVTSSPESKEGLSQRPFAELADLLEKKARD
ncbi:MAG: YceD family protein [Xanthomonadales bacterium]|nr:YceD family protein [Xanthomonadales bacterium]